MMFWILTYLRPRVNEPDMARVYENIRTYREVYSHLRVHKWYETYRYSHDYWKNWDGRSIIVRLKDGKGLPDIVKGYNFKRLEHSPSYVVELRGEKRNVEYVKYLLDKLNSDPSVEYAEPNLLYKATYWPNDPYMGTDLWGLWAIYADKAWDITVGVSSVKVCVVDQGVDYLHEDISANYGFGKDMVDLDNDPYPVSSTELHGTHVAGTIAAVMNNSTGVVGVSQSLILSCRALNDSGIGSSAQVSDCIRWCADTGANIISMSLGSSSPAAELESAVNYAVDTHGVVVIAASGNDGASSVNFPAAYDAVISVGAVDTSGVRASFSNYGPKLDLVAPGVMILSTVPFLNRYQSLNGTSMATPHVSGVAALILSKNPNLTPAEVRGILTGTAIDMGELGKDWFYGYGLVNSYRALLATPSPVFSGDFRENDIVVRSAGEKTVIKSRSVFSLYDPLGKLIFRGREFASYLHRGVYLMSHGGKVRKILVK